LIFSAAKSIVEADKFIRGGSYKQWEPMGFLGPQITGKTLGVVGLGRIGSMVAEIANKGLKMKVLYYDVTRNEEFEKEVGAGKPRRCLKRVRLYLNSRSSSSHDKASD
jgi:glyoxylate reductase